MADDSVARVRVTCPSLFLIHCLVKSALAVAPQHDLASLCTTLENSGREGLMTLLAESNMGATAKHPRPRMAMTAYLMKEGCGLVNTQQLHSGMGGAAGDVSSLLPKVILLLSYQR